ncbi:hypothetical protein AcV7_008688 [Taiwanofungus camphoratus]|nr:hypothetical protein AcV7_008688 [Antrodia cinnamomea]
MSVAQAPPQASSLASAAKQKEPQTFEFTKRKRWADLLVTELNEAIMLVLSATCKVWYCGAAVTELLGWRDDDLVDGDLVDLMNVDDRAGFRALFRESVHAQRPLLAYARLQCKAAFYVARDYAPRPREVLFEITGHAHPGGGAGAFQCFFAVAKPYPSRNTAMLNTFLELKMENERLQQRLLQLRAQHQAAEAPPSGSASAANDPVSANPSHLPHGHSNMNAQAHMYGGEDSYYANYDDLASNAATGGLLPGDLAYPASASEAGMVTPGPGDDNTCDPNGSRKKLKRSYTSDQYVCVTCGRTDSPEWRKGPLGPKTLCNACGLRWAKKVRKPDGEGETSGSGVGPLVF